MNLMNHKKATATSSFYSNVADLRLTTLLKMDFKMAILCNTCKRLLLNSLWAFHLDNLSNGMFKAMLYLYY